MADMSKEEKLAAARRKLKEFQQKNKETTGTKNAMKKHATKSSTGKKNTSEQSYVFDSGTGDISLCKTDSTGTPPAATCFQPVLGSYVHDASLNDSSDGSKEAVIIDDSLNLGEYHNVNNSTAKVVSNPCFPETKLETQTLSSEKYATVESTVALSEVFYNMSSSDLTNANEFFDNIHSQTTLITEATPFASSFEGHNNDVAQTAIMSDSDGSNIIPVNLGVESALISSRQVIATNRSNDDDHLTNDVQSDAVAAEKVMGQYNSLSSEFHASELNETYNNPNIYNQNVNTPENSIKTNSRSSTESLRQLSLQMNGLIDEPINVSGINVSKLEQRNQELASMLANEQQKIEQLQLQVKDYQSRVSQLQVDIAQMQGECEARIAREIQPVQEQLQLHIHTVGILVGEKTELHAALNKSQQTAKQKAAEVEELQGRLKASRHKVSDLEKEIASLSGINKQLEDSIEEHIKEVDRIKMEKGTIKKQLEETEEEVSELRQNFNTQSNELVTLQQELQEKQSQLDLLKLRVQQLSSCDSPDADSQLEALYQHKISLERQVVELQQAVKSSGIERDQASQQYQDYLQQFNTQLKNMAEKLASTSAENERLSNREQSLVRHVSELEKQLQHQIHKNRELPTQKEVMQIKEYENIIASLKVEKEELAQKLDNQVSLLLNILCQFKENVCIGKSESNSAASPSGAESLDFDEPQPNEYELQEDTMLHKQLEESSKRIEELETIVETFEADQPDKNRLLAAIESDKVAAAQAVSQNKKLKQQLEELQEGFIKMSNEKLELTENLLHEQHVCKEWAERLVRQEGEMNDLRNLLQEKDKQMQHFKGLPQPTKESVKQNEIAECTGHESQEHLIDMLQQELSQAKQHIQTLSSQNSELQILLKRQSYIEKERVEHANEGNSHKKDILADKDANVRQAEIEVEVRQTHELQENSLHSIDSGIDPQNYISIKEAMEKLQSRFTKTMEEVAELSDEKQRLEHLVLQLQGETETIGEYITLYQVQRAMLRQRAQEKDAQLSQLKSDREEMRMKLNELTNLVQRLLLDKNDPTGTEVTSEQPLTLEMQIPESQGLLNGNIENRVAVLKENNDVLVETDAGSVPASQEDTAGKIMALITEIGKSTLIEPQTRNMENFHPCPWCSGRLITV